MMTKEMLAAAFAPSALFVLMGGIFYLLHISGYLVTNKKTAVLFIGKFAGNYKDYSATFEKCTGYIHKVNRYKESRTYNYTFTANLTSGNVTVTLYNKARQPIMKLDPQNTAAAVEIEKGKTYYMTVVFDKTSGNIKIEHD